ncbi:MAG: hypothetical protein QOE33_505 [Acidobacteriota bacterium]|nr:hypothetical protein [Acidobacteriota bacterium]
MMAGKNMNKVKGIAGTILSTAFALTLLAATALAQNSFDHGTPTESKGGTSTASTYAPDKLETVNLANGNLAINLPLATVGGRGSTSFTVLLSYNSKLWSTQHDQDAEIIAHDYYDYNQIYVLEPAFDHYKAVYDTPAMKRPGVIALGGGWTITPGPYTRTEFVHIDPTQCLDPNYHIEDGGCYKYVLTKMWLVLPDGSEIEMRDALTDGAPSRVPSPYTVMVDRDRGRVWRSTDGSNVTLVTDTPGTWVFFPDGSRYRTSQGRTTMYDRQANYLTIDYDTPSAGSTTYTDQLGRQTILQSAGGGATVTVKGYGGVPDRVITVGSGVIGALNGSGIADNLRADFRSLPRPFTDGDAFRDRSMGYQAHTITTAHTDLFDGSEGGENIDQHSAVTSVTLPDGHSIRFRYNQYGEVAEVIYPGGGVSQIDYEGYRTTVCGENGPADFYQQINRKVTQRRLLTDSANVDGTWLYAFPLPGNNVASTVETHQGGSTGPLMMREHHYFLATDAEYTTCLSGNTPNGTGYEKWQNAKEYRVERETGTGTQVTVRNWAQRAAVVWANDVGLSYNDYVTHHSQEQPANDPRVMSEETALEDGRKKLTEYTYDDSGNVTSEKEYDFGDTSGSTGALLRQTFRNYVGSLHGYCYTNLNGTDGSCGTGLATDLNSVIYQRSLLLNQTIKDGAGNQEAYSEIEYDNYSQDGNNAPLAINSGMSGYDGSRFSFFSASTQPRGNVTRSGAWAGDSSFVNSYARYDNAGNVVSTKDARGIESFVSYTDSFADGVGRATYAFATSTSSAVPDPTNQRGTNTPLTASTVYEFATGKPRTTTDANGKTTSFQYNDPLDRVTRVDRPDAGWTLYSYATATCAGTPCDYVRMQTALDASRSTDSYQFSDGFGRQSRSLSYVGNLGTPYATTDMQYDALGRVKRVSNPYLTVNSLDAVNPSGRWTTSAYDLAGRVTSVVTPDGAAVTSSYNGRQVTVTDQAGKVRSSVSDALGRLVQVVEDPTTNGLNYQTNYAYDARGNLRQVIQDQPPNAQYPQGVQQRRYFMYDSLSRLIRARNPEQAVNTILDTGADPVSGNYQWTMAYDYDADGNLSHRTDTRGVTTAYTYDNLNRIIRTDYNDGVTSYTLNTYDFATNGRGRYFADYESSTQGTLNFVLAYDAAGRPTSRKTNFYLAGTGWIDGYAMSRLYNLAGNVTQQSYPSGHTVNYSYDAAGRLADNGNNLAFTGNLGDGVPRTYARGLSYDEASRLRQEQFGTQTPLYHKLHYNVRGQLYDVRLSSVAWQPDTNTGQWDWNRGALINYYSQNEVNATTGEARAQSGAENNGNLKRADAYVPTDANATYDGVSTAGSYFSTQSSYSYDSLNRLMLDNEANYNSTSGWGQPLSQGYAYDRWGNRQINTATTTAGINNKQFTIDTSTNRLYAPGGSGMSYDPAGNLTQDVYSASAAQRAYDAENRMTMEQNSATSIFSRYKYDAEGKRVRRDVGGQVMWQVYGFDGELVAEYAPTAAFTQPQKEYGYRAGELLVTATAPATTGTSGIGGSGNLINVAAAANGATASASFYDPDNTFGAGLHTRPSDAIDGVRYSDINGTNYWRAHPLPSQWLRVDFSGSKTIGEVDVYTLRDNYAAQSDPSANETFSLYGASDYYVEYWTGSAWVQIPGASVSGNNLAWRKLTFTPVTTTAIRLTVTGAADGVARITELEAWGTAATATRTNVAAAANGATANASSYDPDNTFCANTHTHPSDVIDGVRAMTEIACGTGYWRAHPLPSQWLEVDFSGQKSISEIDVYTVRDNYTDQSDPLAAETFSLYGASTYDVQYWTGSAWATVSGGSVSGNNLVWKKLTFPTVATSKIRVVVNAAADGVARIAEVEAYEGGQQQFSGGAQGTGAEVNWLVSDHLGTPRIIANQTGALAGIKRHDYLPFGEEIGAGTGGRSQAQGYGQVDNVRQRFTSKERDVETGLDYFGARYYGSIQGRFISSDPLLSSARLENPQTWNRYPYTLNNPLRFVDPTGLFTIGSPEYRKQIIAAYDALKASLDKLKPDSKAYKNIARSLERLGKPDEKNGVVVNVGATESGNTGETDVNKIDKGTVTITINQDQFDKSGVEARASVLGHEGVHADDAFNLFSMSRSMADFRQRYIANDYQYRTEYNAYFASAGVFQAYNVGNSYGWYSHPPIPGSKDRFPVKLDLWNPSWQEVDQKTIESNQSFTIKTVLETPRSESINGVHGYGLRPPKNFQP